ncbi:MAG: sulfite exporter TauE/SafE family protein [Bifidobacteriaceae bacterium]|jgi:uncharacterized membrane protein YfcA|nr:sulfite exporter TauE/SafE family protein [Bifidobacteriaceae bacterium]
MGSTDRAGGAAAGPAAGTAAGTAWWRFALAGALGGVLSGMFGVGGGLLMVPLLIMLAGLDQRRASATSLLAIIPTAAVGAAAYGARGQLAVAAAAIVAIGAIAGTWLGARALRVVRLAWLRWAFVAFLAAVALWMTAYQPHRGAQMALSWAGAAGLAALGVAMGLTSGLFGVGGGSIAVPVLMAAFGASDLTARGTSLLIMVPAAVTGTAVNLRGGLVHVRGGLIAGAAATAATFLGSAAAFAVSPRAGNLLFAALLAASAAQLGVRAWRARAGGPKPNPPAAPKRPRP